MSANIPDIDLHEHAQSCPTIAHRPKPVWDMSNDDCEPLEDYNYRQYKFLGRIPNDPETTRNKALAIARKKFHSQAKVFNTARYYVAYLVI